MRTRLLRLTALSIGGLAALAGDLPRLNDSGSFAAGFSWISAAHADDADVGGGNGENRADGGDQGGENVGSGGSNGTEGGGDGGGGGWGTGDGSGSGGVPGGTGAGGGGAAVIDSGSDSHGENRSSVRDSRDYGPTGNVWHGGSNFLNLFRQTPERRFEPSQPEPSARQKTVHTKREP
ncbi:hypothetical protein PWG15_20660 (plasmid) [Ensifer adhaerens]|uniref:hypothetical protein n=1 Tax=Ensifer adhaerens TaxID=106592 RepID=UPI0023A9BDF2|nr:hypothetical protein [Ensifer adhaerens]WDZ80214.1 hypothetical protein PWG15_20660 [Ensifer adhaerens]